MIYLIDDQASYLRALRTMLEIKEHDSRSFNNAKSAFDELIDRNLEVRDIILIDMVLAPGYTENNNVEFLSDKETRGYTITGKVLAELFIKHDRKKFQKKIGILTGAARLDNDIVLWLRKQNIPLIPKWKGVLEIILEIEAMIRALEQAEPR